MPGVSSKCRYIKKRSEARGAGANQERIGKRDVIAHQQRCSLARQVVRSAHLDAIERVRQQKEAQPNHEVRQHRQDVPRGGEGNHGHDQENLMGLHAARSGEELENARA